MPTRIKKRSIIFLLVFMALAQSAWGAGFCIYEWSARGNALGGTLIARADDPSAVAYNPAGITQLSGIQVQGGFTLLMPQATLDVAVKKGIQTGKSASADTHALGLEGLAPSAFMTAQINDNFWFGIGLYSRFGLAAEYDSSWIGRYTQYFSGVKTYSLSPVLAYKINDEWSVAAGIEAMYFGVEIKRKIPSTPDSDLKMSGDCWAPGYNLALRYEPTSWFAAGLTYRGEVHPHVKGDADFSGPIETSGLRQDQGMYGYLDLPSSWTLGVAVKPMKNLSLEADLVYTLWSSYKDITFDFDKDGVTKEEKKWKDVWRLQLGAEYAVNEWLDLRCGYVFDKSPINEARHDYMVPMSDRHIFSLGTGMHWGAYTLDLSYGYLYSPQKTVTFPENGAKEIHEVTFKNAHCHMVGLSVSYAF